MDRRRDESGAILVITAMVLVVLLGVSALALDIGAAHVQERKIQNGADASALAAAQDLPATSGSAQLATAVADAQNVAAQNLPKSTLAWPGCLDAKHLVNVSGASQCISFGPGFGSIRVRIPRQTFPTLFGGVLGFKTLSTSESAVAKVNLVGGGNGVEPFTILSGFGAGDFCLDSGGGGNSTQPCDGPSTGNFGLLDFATCSGNNYGLRDDIAAGADHFYAPEAVQGVGDVPDNCTQPGPNTVSPSPGNKVGQESQALVGAGPFADGGPGRLRRWPANTTDFSPTWERTTDGLDNRPLWEFIPDTTQPGIPANCQRATFTGLLASTPAAQQQAQMYWALDRCVFEYTCGKLDTSVGPNDALFTNPNTRYGCGGPRAGAAIPACGGTQCRAPVFAANTSATPVAGLDTSDLAESPRFVYLPQMWQTTPINGNSGTYEIKAFRAVFIQGVGPNNGARFEPGPWNTGNAPIGSIANLTGFIFPSPLAGCTPTPTDSCGTMLPGRLGIQPVSIGDNAVVQLTG
jgi:hypothetical protein